MGDIATPRTVMIYGAGDAVQNVQMASSDFNAFKQILKEELKAKSVEVYLVDSDRNKIKANSSGYESLVGAGDVEVHVMSSSEVTSGPSSYEYGVLRVA